MPLLRPFTLFYVLTFLLTGCAPQAPGGSSSVPEDVNPDASVVEELPPEPEPEPEPQPVLTQADVDQALEEVMADYTAAAVSVATIEHGQLSQSGAWGWAIKN